MEHDSVSNNKWNKIKIQFYLRTDLNILNIEYQSYSNSTKNVFIQTNYMPMSHHICAPFNKLLILKN